MSVDRRHSSQLLGRTAAASATSLITDSRCCDDWSAIADMGRQSRHLIRTEGDSPSAETQLAAELPDSPRPLVGAFRTQLLAVVPTESATLTSGERRVGSSQVLESLFGKGKRLEGQQSRSGFTRNVLSLAASVVDVTTDVIRDAFATVGIKHLRAWTKQFFSNTVQSKRRRDLPNRKSKQKQDKQNQTAIPNF